VGTLGWFAYVDRGAELWWLNIRLYMELESNSIVVFLPTGHVWIRLVL